MDECKVCANADNEYCFACDNGNQFKPITNYDRLRAKSMEEMAEFMNCGACPPGRDVTELCHDEDGGSVPYMCNLCWLDWLKQEVET